MTIGTEKGSGGGSIRNLQFIIGGTSYLDYGVTTANVWSFSNNGTLPTVNVLSSGTTATQIAVTNTSTGGHQVLIGSSGSLSFPGPGHFIFYDQTANREFFTCTGAFLEVPSDGIIGWNPNSGSSSSANPDTAMARNAAGIIEVNTGTAGTFGSIKALTYYATGDGGGIASTNALSNGASTTISTGVGVIHMSTANPATNSGWLKCYIGTQVAWIPCWTTNAP